MPVSHAPVPSRAPGAAVGRERVPGLLAVLAQVTDPRQRRGRRFPLVFVLAVAVVCALAGARSFREAGDMAADLPQEVLARLGGVPHPLRRVITAPSEKRIRTLLQALDAAALDVLIGGWLDGLARDGQPEQLPRAVAIDGKWLRGVGNGQVKLLAAMLHEEKAVIGQVRVPDRTTETTRVKELLKDVGLAGAVVTADAFHASRETAAHIAGSTEDGGRAADYFLFVKGNTPHLQRAAFDAIQATGPREPDHAELDYGHGRVTRRSIWVAGAAGLDFPRAARVARIRRDGYDRDGQLVTKEIVHAVTSLDAARAGAARLAAIARGQWGIESHHWLRDTTWAEDASTGYAGNGPQVMATLRNLAISLLRIAGITQITRTAQAINRNPARVLAVIPL
jgi:predicted transposase YbfD/YdcC